MVLEVHVVCGARSASVRGQRGRHPYDPSSYDDGQKSQAQKRGWGLTVDGVADEEEATDDVEERRARGVLAVKVASLVASEGRHADVLLGRGALGELWESRVMRSGRGVRRGKLNTSGRRRGGG